MDSACRVQEFARRAGVDVALRDIIEWFWVKDIADLTWEILRIRRFKVGIIDVAKKSALEAIMLSLTETGEILSFEPLAKLLVHAEFFILRGNKS